ncbi:hypothetical protein HYV74_00730 [Candidatus Uhrbacteria bacterium]|nr:hypothetical protein [Candidatus Uhrbacteria bacterium]
MIDQKKTVRAAFANVQLRDILNAHCEACWAEGWKKGKTAALDNPNNPFVGGPQDLLVKGIAEVTKPDGSMVTITKLTRLRLRELDDVSLAMIGTAMGKNLVGIRRTAADNPDENARNKILGSDVVHQEYVDTFGENVDNDYKHFLNNAVAAAAVLECAVSFVGKDLTIDELADAIEATLRGERPDLALLFSLASRSSWIGRAVQDQSWKNSGDFAFYFGLTKDVAAIDAYVAGPVLERFAQELRSGKYNS